MVITFYGEGCFKLQSGDFIILSDPFDGETGLTPPRFKADIILKTFFSIPIVNSQRSMVNGQIIYGPGEYNIRDINITGFALPKESPASAKATAGKSEKFLKTIYLLELEDVKLCFLGHLSEMPEPAILEHLEEINVLFVPAGGPPFLNQKSAVKIIKQLQPKIVIPCFFKIPSLKRPADKLEKFLEEFNGPKTKEMAGQEKLVIKKKDFANIKKTEVVILKV